MFLLGLLLPIYTITGYDASAHTSEETLQGGAFRAARHGHVGALVGASSARCSCAPSCCMIPNMDEAAKQGWNVFFWAIDAAGRIRLVKEIVYLVDLRRAVLCGLATVTSASRMIFAFSRDGGLPGSKALSKVSPKYRTPVAAIWTGAVLSVLFVWGTSLVSIAGRSAYTIVVSCTVIFLFLSFTVPIALGLLRMGHAEVGQDGAVGPGRAASSSCSPCSRSCR